MSDNTPRSERPGNDRRSAATEQRLTGRAQRKVAQEQSAKRQRQTVIIGGIAAIAAVALLVFLVFVRRPAAPEVALANPPAESIPVAGRTMGDPGAPVTVVEWGDYT